MSSSSDAGLALRGCYRVAVHTSILASERTLGGKTKCTKEDVALPFRVMLAVDSDTICREGDEDDDDEPFTHDTFYRYRGGNSGGHLGSKEVKELLRYCLDSLADEMAREVAGTDLTNMLVRLCSRRDYVCWFRSEEIGFVLHEARDLILDTIMEQDREGSGNRATAGTDIEVRELMRVHAAKAFSGLVKNCVCILGFDLAVFVGPCLDLAEEWAVSCLKDEYGYEYGGENNDIPRYSQDRIGTNGGGRSIIARKQMIPHVYSVIVDLFSAYPELCVGIFREREHSNKKDAKKSSTARPKKGKSRRGEGCTKEREWQRDNDRHRDQANGYKTRDVVNKNGDDALFSYAKKICVSSFGLGGGGGSGGGGRIGGLGGRGAGISVSSTADVLVEYFSAHLLVCEVAGHLQGLMPGDIGDAGVTTLRTRGLDFLLEVFLSDRAMSSLSLHDDSTAPVAKTKIRRNEREVNGRQSISNRKRRRIGDRSALEGKEVDEAGRRRQKQRRVKHPIPFPIDRRERRRLELCARLLRCAQRRFLAEADLETASSTTTQSPCFHSSSLSSSLDPSLAPSTMSSSSSSNWIPMMVPVPVAKLSACPWAKFIRGLVSPSRNQISSTPTRHKDNEKKIHGHGVVPHESDNDGDGPANKNTQQTMLSAIQKDSKRNEEDENKDTSVMVVEGGRMDNIVTILPRLRIIAACAEVFPRGECWSSCNSLTKTSGTGGQSSLSSSPLDHRNLHKIGGHGDDHYDDGIAAVAVGYYCNVCEPEDLAAVVSIVSDILRSHGGATGDKSIQGWALVVLLKLVESTAIIRRYHHRDNSNNNDRTPQVSVLVTAWRDVWSTLFRHDLGYVSYTSGADPMSLGDTVLMLITEIIRCCCVDGFEVMQSFPNDDQSYSCQPLSSDFVRLNQIQIWNLPVFSDATSVKTASPFELATLTIMRAGLIEDEGETPLKHSSHSSPDAFDNQSFASGWKHLRDGTPRKRIEMEALEGGRDGGGGGRRHRLARFCLRFIESLINRSSANEKLEKYTSCDHDANESDGDVKNTSKNRDDHNYHDYHTDHNNHNSHLRLQHLLPSVAGCFASILGGKGVIPVTTYSMRAFRELRCASDDIVMSYEYNISRNPSSSFGTTTATMSLHNSSSIMLSSQSLLQSPSPALATLFEDVILPFGSQFYVEGCDGEGSRMWHLMRGREKYRLCPAWSTSDRMWLRRKLMCMVKINLDSVTIADSSNMRDFGLLTIKHMLLSHNTGNKAKQLNIDDIDNNSDIPLSCKMSIVKIVLVLILSNSENQPTAMIDNSESTSLAARMVKPIMNEVALKLKNLLSSLPRYSSSTVKESIRFNVVATDLLGIIRLARDFFVSGACPMLVSFLFENRKIDKRSGTVLKKIGVDCRKIMRLHALAATENRNIAFDNDLKKNNAEGPGDYCRDYNSNVDKIDNTDELSFDDDEEESQSCQKKSTRKGVEGCRDKIISRQVQQKVICAPDSVGAWLCASIFILLDPSIGGCQFVADTLIWPWETIPTTNPHEPHNYVLGLSLFCPFVTRGGCEYRSSEGESKNNQQYESDTNQEDSDQFSTFSLCLQLILRGRTEAVTFSPFYLFGFHSCYILIKVRNSCGLLCELDDLECDDLLSVLDPLGSMLGQKVELRKTRRALNSRPYLKG